MMKLYHKNTLIGSITNASPEDMFEMSGDIHLTREAEVYRSVFEFLTDEERMSSGAEPPFAAEYLEGWFLEDEDGNRKEIVCPGIYFDDREVFWRE